MSKAVRSAMEHRVGPRDRRQPDRRADVLSQLIEDLRGTVGLDLGTRYPTGAPGSWFIPTGSSIDVAILPASFSGRDVVVKFTTNDVAKVELEASNEHVRELSADPRLRDWAHYLPMIITTGRIGPLEYVVEECLSPRDARSIGADTPLADSVIAESLSAISDLHRMTGRVDDVGELHLKALVDDPVAIVRGGVRSGVFAWRYRALDLLAGQLRGALTSRPVNLGRVHGDLHLGNIMIDGNRSHVVGFIDWGRSSPESLESLDRFTLLITHHAQRRREELGTSIVALLEELAGLTDDAVRQRFLGELRSHLDEQGGLPMRETLLMTWLVHVSNNLKFEERTRLHFLWSWENVDVVLDRLWDV